MASAVIVGVSYGAMPPTPAKVWQTKPMAIFTRNNKAALAVSLEAEPQVKAAVGYNAGAKQIGEFYSYYDGERNTAISVPTISRARDLIASVIGRLPLKFYKLEWNEADGEYYEYRTMSRSWGHRIDRSVTNNFILSWTFDDLFFYGRAFWYVQERYADGFPASFTRLPAAMCTTTDQAGPIWFGPSKEIRFNGLPIDSKDVIQFLSPIQGITTMSTQTIKTALKLEAAAFRNASVSMPAGVLRQVGGEPLSAQELADMAHAFNEARLTNQTAALNEFLTYTESTATPDKQLITQAREFQALELARVANIPPYLAGIATGGYTYQNAQQARQDLWIFAAAAYAECISATLSSDNVLPRGNYVKLDPEDYLNELVEEMEKSEPEGAQNDAPGDGIPRTPSVS